MTRIAPLSAACGSVRCHAFNEDVMIRVRYKHVYAPS
jgi:hypothetical protein